MTRAGLPTAVVLAMLMTSAFAADQERLERRGYQVLWHGYASFETCVHGQDRYQMGNLVFICDQHTYDYPYHYGNVVLMGQRGASGAFICMGEGDDCIAGSIAAR